MKTLVIIRHAKSSWNRSDLRDFDRPLNARGKRDAPLMAERLRARNILPVRIYSSPALRAVTTARVFADVLGIPQESLLTDDSIYSAGLGELMGVIARMDDTASPSMLVGHNPGISELIMNLTGRDTGSVPTCAVTIVSLDTPSWSGVSERCGDMLFHDYPKKSTS